MTPTDLRATITRLGLSQVGAAKVLGIDDRTMRRWIAGEREISPPAILALRMMVNYKIDPWEAAGIDRISRPVEGPGI